MDFNAGNARTLLGQFEFAKLFIDELGWDRHGADLSVPIAGTTFALRAVAEKRGMVAWVCQAPVGLQIPDRATRKKIETQVAKTTLEHLIIFTDETRAEQIWCWARREAGKPASVPEHFWYASSGNRGFLQKLEAIAFSLAEENTLTLVDVTTRARAAFDVERVTKRFYDQFKAEHKAFLDFISGITELADKEWYASLMLNRMMFIYFMQRKRFLDNKPNYLADKLAACKAQLGQDKFYSFYRIFLLRLFHEGLGGKARNPELDKLLGRIPYLNGGLFEKHPIEERCPDIKIPDEAFTRIFAYFDRYQWHLDERPLRNDNEINPDVLGYIFEKYINQKQMGAYYTKEDITEYISKNTVIPFLFDAAKARCKVAFENPGGPTNWDHLRDDPDRYIYTAVKHGAEHALPPEIAAGIEDVSARTQWNQKAPADFGLPTEIWREVVARRTRYAEVRAKLAAGEVREINDLITLNLDIRQFAQDVIERCEGPDLLRAFWKAIEGVTVLDPTCGSGAFLFAALNILEPLYETCLDRMEAFVADLERSGEGHAPKKFEDFKAILTKVSAHPNARYFTLKSIILNNLFGVDIMEEAVEICKLRLFLKLAAQVDPDQKHDNLGIEPLPDIDFNIRAGNTLVGYATYADVKKALTSKLDLDNSLDRITRRAADLQQTFDVFRQRQVDGDGSVPLQDKLALRQRLKALDDELSLQLAKEYGLRPDDLAGHAKWARSHQPFHWFIEFHGIMNEGGFDVIVGNPPWVEYPKVKNQYKLMQGYETITCNNLWAFVVERSYELIPKGARVGLIVPMSLVCTERMSPVQSLATSKGVSWFANFESDSNPGQLFNGVKQNVTILLSTKTDDSIVFTTRLFRFFSEFRDFVFSGVQFIRLTGPNLVGFGIPKANDPRELAIIEKLSRMRKLSVIGSASRTSRIFVHRIAHYYIKCFDFVPYFWSERDGEKKSEDYKEYGVPSPPAQFVATVNSSVFYLYWQVYFDAFKAGKNCVESFPFGDPSKTNTQEILVEIANRLMNNIRGNSKRLNAAYKTTGDVEYDQFFPRKSKAIMDEIDCALARHYGFSSEETDFIINYDIKFRAAGLDLEDETAEVREDE
ncbi:Eco57I restriction-modification methylase domain-containing protein [Mesorhizobium australicum]|uniref:Eco57I restriction-modification methylase domain-containing protein n=1 Tax=Mesorhizobium australicum TaxID=536018 RepID=UPI00333976F5